MEVDLIVRRKNRKVITVSPGTTMVDAARTLAENRIGLLMVVGEGGKFIGVLSERDIVRAMPRLCGPPWASEARANSA